MMTELKLLKDTTMEQGLIEPAEDPSAQISRERHEEKL